MEETIFQGQRSTQNPVPNQGTPPVSPPAPQGPPPPPPTNQPPPIPPSPVPIDHTEGPLGSSRGKILKLLLGFLIVLGLAFVIFALILPRFGGTSQKGEVTLTYWGLWEDQNIMNAVISDFEKENPKIKVEYSKQDIKDYREKLNTRIENGTGPDIFRFHNSWYPMLQNDLLPLPKQTIEKQEFLDSYYKVAQQDLIKNGAIYGIPIEVDTLAMYVNPALFDNINIPTTWQEFIDAASKITQRDEGGNITIAGAGIGTYENVDHSPDIISLLFAQNGVDMENITKSSNKVNDALTFYTNFSLIENNVWDSTLDTSLRAFAKGKLAMHFGYSWDYFAIKALDPGLDFKIVPVPQLLTNERVDLASYWAEGVSAKSKNQDEALLFIKFLTKPGVAEKLYAEESKTRLFGEPYAHKKLASKLSDSSTFVFVDQAKTAVSSPFVSGTQDNGLNDKLNSYLKDAINAILTDSSLETASETLFNGYSQVKEQYGTQSSN